MRTKLPQKEIIDGWNIVKMDDICEQITNGFVGKAIDHYTEKGDGILYIQGYNITDNGFNLHGIKKVTREFSDKNKKSILKEGDLLTVQTGEVGQSAVVPKNLEGANCHALIISRFIRGKASPYYFVQYYRSSVGKKLIWKIKIGSTMEHVNVGHLKNVILFLPRLPEQNNIVEVLETWDKTIDKLMKKIEIKKQIKNGLMQELLTGKTRLQGFKHKWTYVELGEVCKRLTYRNVENNENIITISAQEGLVSQGRYFGKRIAADNLMNYWLLHKGDFAYNKSYSNGYPMGAIKRLDKHDKGVVSSLYIVFAPHSIDSNYLKYYFDLGLYNRAIGMVAQEGARNHGLLNIGVDDFFSGDLHIPKSKEEQVAIAYILMTVDKEISGLEKKLFLLRDQKKFLLNNLITGAIRTPETLY